jgi:bisphosphoglycerate-dependent phosphoglycerate mutase
MKKIILTVLLLLIISISFSQEVKVKEVSGYEFRIQHKFISSESDRKAYENRLFSLFNESIVESLKIKKKYIVIIFNQNELRNVIENTLIEFSKVFGYNSIKIK